MFRLRFGKFSLTLALRRRQIVWFGAFAVTALFAAAITKPNTFSDGDTLSASKLNENFDTLYTKVNELDGRLSAEEAKGKTWRLIYETDVTSATTTLNITGLNGDVDLEYQIRCRFVAGAVGAYYLRPNGDSTVENNGDQEVLANGATPSGSQSLSMNGYFLAQGVNIGTISSFLGDWYAKSGVQRQLIGLQHSGNSGTTIDYARLIAAAWNNTSSNIISATVVATVANGIGAGSHIEIWARR